MCRGMGMRMNVGAVCYSCLVGAKRVGGNGRIIFWIDFDYTTVLSSGWGKQMRARRT
jgi:hypothetical protein